MAQSKFNHFLDRLVRPTIWLMGRFWPTFQISGYSGLALTVLLGIILVTHAGLSYWTMSGLILTAVATILAMIILTKLLTGAQQLTYHHYEIAVLGSTSLLLYLLDQPLLTYLDIVILGAGAFLMCGRVGCFMAGCCHGQPHRWGVCYRHEHTAAGIAPYLIGIRLFPIQIVESLYVLSILLAGIPLVWSAQPAGSALAWYIMAYNAGRFSFEFVRGDPGRPYWLGFSEAQWTALLLTGGVAGLELAGIVPFSPWHMGVPLLLASLMILFSRFCDPAGVRQRQLYHPTHIAEVAGALERIKLAPDLAAIAIEETSLGIRISAGSVEVDDHQVEHYTLSAHDGNLSAGAAALLAKLVLALQARGRGGSAVTSQLLEGSRGAYHLLIQPARPE
jgi:prolipoprotein diacylglyceryltransferase